jgi:hypothetical protein
MSKPTDLGAYLKESKDLFQHYIETRVEILRLQMIRSLSKAIGSLVWLILLLFILFLLLIFIGLILGFLFSEITGSNVIGFSISTGILFLFALLLILLRRTLFIDPVVRLLIGIFSAPGEDEEDEQGEEDDYN